MNGIRWRVRRVQPESLLLIDRTSRRTVATTDPFTHQVYISTALGGDFLRRVLAHELGHCAMVSYRMLDNLHRMTKPECRVEMEEWACNFLADFYPEVQSIVNDILRGGLT